MSSSHSLQDQTRAAQGKTNGDVDSGGVTGNTGTISSNNNNNHHQRHATHSMGQTGPPTTHQDTCDGQAKQDSDESHQDKGKPGSYYNGRCYFRSAFDLGCVHCPGGGAVKAGQVGKLGGHGVQGTYDVMGSHRANIQRRVADGNGRKVVVSRELE